MKAGKVKRIFDVLISGMSLVILSPIFLTISICIKLDSKGPVIFKQKRLGINGKVFDMYKFRSMVPDAEKMAAGLFNYENDPRVTKVGRFLRTSS
ncbi:MAG: sugar transferase, partial [Acetivibrio ethanolgignens]